jgi:hypothetical protein
MRPQRNRAHPTEDGMPKRHKLGFGNGTIIEYEDGTAGYIPTMSLTQAFRVKISDVTGFSVTKGHKMLERQINVMGNGTLLGATSVNHGTSEAIEKWFRAHPSFAQQPAPPAHGSAPMATSPSVADEIRKLAALRSEGVLTDEEFAAAKERLIGG